MSEARFFLDVVHPYCYLALPAVRAAIDRGHQIEIIPWEKRPAPVALYQPRGDYLRDDWVQRVYPAALERGIEIHLPVTQPRSTIACAAYAGYAGNQRDALLDALFSAYFVEGLDLGNDLTIASAATAAGVSVSDVWTAGYDPDVRAALIAARARAVDAGAIEIPALLIPGEEPVIGLQAVEARLAQML